jgi:hypothetical protein
MGRCLGASRGSEVTSWGCKKTVLVESSSWSWSFSCNSSSINRVGIAHGGGEQLQVKKEQQ